MARKSNKKGKKKDGIARKEEIPFRKEEKTLYGKKDENKGNGISNNEEMKKRF